MKIKFLGTAAAEGLPALFCDCKNCTYARKVRGKNIRSRSQSIIDNSLLIDFPADTYLHYVMHDFDLPNVKNCLITHGHMDHFYLEDVEMRKVGCFSNLKNNPPLNFYATEEVCKRIIDLKRTTNTLDSDVTVNLVKAYKTYQVGEYTVTALPAVHAGYNIETGAYNGYTPVTYIIEKDGKSILYHHDSDFYVKETFEFLKNRNKPFDLVTFDCNNGMNPHDYIGHLGYEDCIKYKNEFLANGLATENTKFVVNHFSHNSPFALYDDMITINEKDGVIVSYDGLEVEI